MWQVSKLSRRRGHNSAVCINYTALPVNLRHSKRNPDTAELYLRTSFWPIDFHSCPHSFVCSERETRLSAAHRLHNSKRRSGFCDHFEKSVMTSSMNRPLKIALVAPSVAILGGQAVQAARLLEAWDDDPDIRAWLVPINPTPPRLLRRSGGRAVRADGPHAVELLAPALPRAPARGRRPRLLRVVLVVPARPSPGGHRRQAAGQARRDELSQRRGAGPSEALGRRARASFDMSTATSSRPPSSRTSSAVSGSTPRSSRTSSTCALRVSRTDAAGPEGAVHPQLREPLQPPVHLACVPQVPGLGIPEATLTLVGAGTQEPLNPIACQEPAPRRSDVCRTGAARRDVAVLRRRRHLSSDAGHRQHALVRARSLCERLRGRLDGRGGVPAILDERCARPARVLRRRSRRAASAMRRLIEDAALASRLTGAARESCARYQWTSVRARWLALYRDLARGATLTAPGVA